MGWTVRLRSVALLLGGAYAVHTLRYALAYGGDAHGALRAQGHAYLAAAPLLLTVLLAVALAALVLRVAGGARERRREASLWRLWGVSAVALLAIFVVQELAEGWLAADHPAGWAAVVAHGGWLAALLSIGMGLLVALAHRGAAVVLAASRGRVPRPRAWSAVALVVWAVPGVRVARVPGPWLGGRGPPALAG
jgi:hypothetical protein